MKRNRREHGVGAEDAENTRSLSLRLPQLFPIIKYVQFSYLHFIFINF
jgi:hypothetical protein